MFLFNLCSLSHSNSNISMDNRYLYILNKSHESYSDLIQKPTITPVKLNNAHILKVFKVQAVYHSTTMPEYILLKKIYTVIQSPSHPKYCTDCVEGSCVKPRGWGKQKELPRHKEHSGKWKGSRIRKWPISVTTVFHTHVCLQTFNRFVHIHLVLSRYINNVKQQNIIAARHWNKEGRHKVN